MQNPTDPASATLARARDALDAYETWRRAPAAGRQPAESILADVMLALDGLLDLAEDLTHTFQQGGPGSGVSS